MHRAQGKPQSSQRNDGKIGMASRCHSIGRSQGNWRSGFSFRFSVVRRLADYAAGDHRLRGIGVELHGEGKQQSVEVFVQGGEVEAEDVPGRLDRVGLLLWFDGNVAEYAGL